MEPYKDLGTYDGTSGFAGALGKVLRAKYQWRDLDERFRARIEDCPPEQFKISPDGTVEYPTVPKREWGVLIGELVHNLRSALDHAAYAAAARPTRCTAFPVCTTRARWEGNETKRMLVSVPDEVIAVIKTAQPFTAVHRRDVKHHMLYVLNELWNHDKHRVLHTAAMRVEALGATSRTIAVVFKDPMKEASVLDGEKVLEVLLTALRGVTHLVTKMEYAASQARQEAGC